MKRTKKKKNGLRTLRLSNKAKRIIISTWLACHSLASIATELNLSTYDIQLIENQLSKELLLSGNGSVKDYLILDKNRSKILSELNATGIVPEMAPQDVNDNYFEILEAMHGIDKKNENEAFEGLKNPSELIEIINKLTGPRTNIPREIAAGTWNMYCTGNTSGIDCKSLSVNDASNLIETLKKLKSQPGYASETARGTWGMYCTGNTSGIDC